MNAALSRVKKSSQRDFRVDYGCEDRNKNLLILLFTLPPVEFDRFVLRM